MKTLVKISFALLILILSASVSFSQTDTTNRSTSESYDRDRDVDIDRDRDRDVNIENDRDRDMNRDRDNNRDRNMDREREFGADNDMTKNDDRDEHFLMKDMHKMMDDMEDVDLTGNFDVDFGKIMIEHHEGGIDMARSISNKGENEELKKMAEAIIDKNEGDIAILKDLVDASDKKTDNANDNKMKDANTSHHMSLLKNSMKENMKEMHDMEMSGNVDNDFAMMMAAHHAHAVEMARMELEYGTSADMKAMAKKIIDSQQKEIGKLKDWSERQK